MTIRERLRLPLRIAGAVALVVCGWLTLVIGLAFAAGPDKSIAIIGPQAQAIAAVVKAKGHILVAYDYVTIARSEEAGFVSRLYCSRCLAGARCRPGRRLHRPAAEAAGGAAVSSVPTTSLRGTIATKQSIAPQAARWIASLRSQ